MVDGAMRKIFLKFQEIDIDQAKVTELLKKEHKNIRRKRLWPYQFNLKVMLIPDVNGKLWKCTVYVTEVSK